MWKCTLRLSAEPLEAGGAAADLGRVVTEGVPRGRLGMSALQEANELEDGGDRDAGVHPDLDRARGDGRGPGGVASQSATGGLLRTRGAGGRRRGRGAGGARILGWRPAF
jgi:hypothetical protein